MGCGTSSPQQTFPELKSTHTQTEQIVMDEANSKMRTILRTQGPLAAGRAMMKVCGGDYGAMRMKYG
jgi:hypothetical protein